MWTGTLATWLGSIPTLALVMLCMQNLNGVINGGYPNNVRMMVDNRTYRPRGYWRSDIPSKPLDCVDDMLTLLPIGFSGLHTLFNWLERREPSQFWSSRGLMAYFARGSAFSHHSESRSRLLGMAYCHSVKYGAG